MLQLPEFQLVANIFIDKSYPELRLYEISQFLQKHQKKELFQKKTTAVE
jgi:hypothetical protein